MFDTILIGLSALNANAQALRNISNNVSNANTIGFKGSHLNFSDLFSQGSDTSGGSTGSSQGAGVSLLSSSIDFTNGDRVETNGLLDLKINGNSFFVLRGSDGELLYTKDGRFAISEDNKLVSATDPSMRVLALDAQGNLTEVDITSHLLSAGKATDKISFQIGSTLNHSVPTTQTPPATTPSPQSKDVTVYDGNGGAHTLTITFTWSSTQPTPAGTGIAWDMSIKDRDKNSVVQINGSPIRRIVFSPATSRPGTADENVSFTYNPPGLAGVPMTISMKELQTSASVSGGSSFTLKADTGYAPGLVTQKELNAEGQLVLTYANQQTAKPAQIALANFQTFAGLRQVGGSLFANAKPNAVSFGTAGGAFGTLLAKHVEKSNVNTTTEFGELLVVQRAFGSASQVVTAAREMMDELHKATGRR
jgi:flagellar hook protein FlgE